MYTFAGLTIFGGLLLLLLILVEAAPPTASGVPMLGMTNSGHLLRTNIFLRQARICVPKCSLYLQVSIIALT